MSRRSKRVREFLAHVEATFDAPDPAQQVMIDEAVALMSRLDDARRRIAADGLTTRGGNGQAVVNPLVAASRQDAIALSRLLAVLFPDSPADPVRSARGRHAARVRHDLRAVRP